MKKVATILVRRLDDGQEDILEIHHNKNEVTGPEFGYILSGVEPPRIIKGGGYIKCTFQAICQFINQSRLYDVLEWEGDGA